MDSTLIQITALATGFLIRLGIPIVLTVLLATLLKRLDTRWEREADLVEKERVLWASVESGPFCWEIHDCPPRLRRQCPAYANPSLPCWEHFRSDGRLKPACRTCRVLPPDVVEDAHLGNMPC